MARFSCNALKFLFVLAGSFMVSGMAYATDVAYSGTFVGTEGLATTRGSAQATTYTRDMNTTGDRVSVQVVASTYTVAVSTNFGANNYTVNTPTITIASNSFITGMQVLLSSGAVPQIGGLSLGSTYYVSVINPNQTTGIASTFKLSATSTGAVAGLGIVLTSSSTSTNRYTLTPLAWTNVNGGVLPQWSDDNANWVNATTGNWAASISSVTFSSSGNSTLWDFGPIQHRYLRMKVTQAATGAMVYTITSNEKYSVTH